MRFAQATEHEYRIEAMNNTILLSMMAVCVVLLIVGVCVENFKRSRNDRKAEFPSYCCPLCGECIGYLGRLFALIFGVRGFPYGHQDCKGLKHRQPPTP
jgi:Mn2+/Fe2+ NRAMP family transporter